MQKVYKNITFDQHEHMNCRKKGHNGLCMKEDEEVKVQNRKTNICAYALKNDLRNTCLIVFRSFNLQVKLIIVYV